MSRKILNTLVSIDYEHPEDKKAPNFYIEINLMINCLKLHFFNYVI
jgi:hypothetical protein